VAGRERKGSRHQFPICSRRNRKVYERGGEKRGRGWRKNKSRIACPTTQEKGGKQGETKKSYRNRGDVAESVCAGTGENLGTRHQVKYPKFQRQADDPGFLGRLLSKRKAVRGEGAKSSHLLGDQPQGGGGFTIDRQEHKKGSKLQFSSPPQEQHGSALA